LSACGTCSAAPTETCNGLDDDCDGTPDQLPQCAACSAPPYEFTGDPPWDLALLNDETYVVTFDTAMKFANAQPLWTVDLLSAPDQMNTGPLILAHNGAVHLAAGREWRTVTGTTTIIQDVTAHATLNLQTGAPSWTRVDPSSNTRTPLALTGTGDTIAIVYTDDAAMNRARLATRVGTAAFTLVGSMTVGVLTWVGAAYNTAGQLHVLYSSNPSNINYRHNVAHSVWGGAAQSAFGSLGYIYSLELDPGPNGSLHTAFTYYEDGQGGTPHTQYLRFDGTNLVPSASEELSWLGGRLGFDQSGQILMIHGAASELLLSRRLASGTWESQPLRSVTGHTLSGYALKVDSVGRHHILYDDVDDATGAERYFYVVACPNWE
jgi:hypothetical protein